ncbi:MAG: hypothetical protein KatS3mg104_0481 [Phycisphaerae bacterium]|nr:MAG: hypothetical protein KatS3mg104_0481 [Phycisphaerae bacterium]
MVKYTLDEFVRHSTQKDRDQGLFELETERVLEVNLNGMIWTKTGSMVAYLGQIRFEREGIFEQGIGTFFKKALTGEGARLTKATGNGKLYLADMGKKVTILNLVNQALCVNGTIFWLLNLH